MVCANQSSIKPLYYTSATYLDVCPLCGDEGGGDVILLDEVAELFFQRASLFPHFLHFPQYSLHTLQPCYLLYKHINTQSYIHKSVTFLLFLETTP